MKWFRILLAAFLLIGVLAFPAVALADPDEVEVKIDIDSEGDVDVDIDIDAKSVAITIDGYTPHFGSSGGGVGLESLANHMGVTRLKRDVAEINSNLNLVATGLSKVITVVTGHHESTLAEHETTLEGIATELGNHLEQLGIMEADLQQLSSRLDTLEAQDEAIVAYVAANTNYLQAYYNRILITVVILFSAVIIGLAIGLGLLWRRLRA